MAFWPVCCIFLNAKTGAKLWSYVTRKYVFSSPAVANGVVYVGSEDSNVYALNANTGVKLWNYSTGGVVKSSPAVANGMVYVGSNHFTLVYAFWSPVKRVGSSFKRSLNSTR